MNRRLISAFSAALAVGLLAFAWAVFGRGDGVDRSRVYKIAYGNDVPFHFRGSDGLPTGLAVDLVREAALVKNIRLEWVPAEGQWRRHADLLVLLSITPDRLRSNYITKAYLQGETYFVVPASSSFRTVADLSELRVSYVSYGIHRDNLAAILPRKTAVPVQTSREALEKVAAGQADAAYLPDYSVRAALLEGGLRTPMRMFSANAPHLGMGIACSYEYAKVADAIRDGMRVLALNGRMSQIVDKWGFSQHLSADDTQEVLTQQRRVKILTVAAAILCASILLSCLLLLNHRRQSSLLRGSIKRLDEIMAALDRSASLEMADEKGRITYVNKKFCSMLKYAPEEIIGKDYRILNSGLHRKSFFADLWSTLQSGKNWHGEICNRAKDGSLRWLDSTITPFLSPDGKSAHYVVIRYDITERKEMDLELTKARDAALESAHLKSEFLANMSHEIRTPMNGVIGMLQLLRESPLDARQTDYARAANICAQDLLAIINDILDVSKIEAGKLRFESVGFHFRQVVEDAFGLFAERAKRKGLVVTSSLAADIPETLRGDPLRLRQVLNNLLSNATKFTAEGEVALAVSREAGSDSGVKLRFSVRDTGIGIAPEVRPRLFTPFTQADGSMSRRYGGTGLGLAISKQLVEKMGGQIDFESTPGKGSTFWFTACFERETRDNAAATERGASAPPRVQFRARSARLPGKILIVEDNAVSQEVARGLLEKIGYASDIAGNGVEALEALRREAYEVVLMDVQMPLMDGYEATRTIRDPKSLVLNHQVPIIALTAHALPEDREKCLEAGMDDYLSKPVSLRALADTLAKWCSNRQNGPPGKEQQKPEGMEPAPGANGKIVFDRAALAQRLGVDEGMVQQLGEAFLKEIPSRLSEMRRSLEARSAGDIGRSAHAIKGACASLGRDQMQQTALEIEEDAKTGNLAPIPIRLAQLEAEFERLKQAMENKAS